MKPSESPDWKPTHEYALFIGGSWDGQRREVPVHADVFEVCPPPAPFIGGVPADSRNITITIERYYRVRIRVDLRPFTVFSLKDDGEFVISELVSKYMRA